jgi:hypothetical protein
MTVIVLDGGDGRALRLLETRHLCIGVSRRILRSMEIGAMIRDPVARLSYEDVEARGGAEPLKLPAYIAAT